MLRTNKAKMKHGYLLGIIFLWNIYVSLGQNIQIVNNCTCKTSDGGIYSLMPLRKTDGSARFHGIPGKKYREWRYDYNPCTPFDLGQNDPDADPHKLCRDVAICKYAEIEKPREYFEVGLQRDISCEISQEGQIELVYKTNDPSIDNPHSRVQFHCNELVTDPMFQVEDDDNYNFSIKHYCACRNRCSPDPGTTTPPQPGPSTPSQPGPSSSTTPSSEPETTSSSPGTPLPRSTDWLLTILLPSLLGALVVVICLVCIWMRLSVIQRARLCRCCHCYQQNRDPPREQGFVPVTEKSRLISDQANDRAVEHEYPGVKVKLNEPVQEEDGDIKGEDAFPGKDNRAIVA